MSFILKFWYTVSPDITSLTEYAFLLAALSAITSLSITYSAVLQSSAFPFQGTAKVVPPTNVTVLLPSAPVIIALTVGIAVLAGAVPAFKPKPLYVT